MEVCRQARQASRACAGSRAEDSRRNATCGWLLRGARGLCTQRSWSPSQTHCACSLALAGTTRPLVWSDFYKAGAMTGFVAAFTEGPIDFYKSQLQVQIIKSKMDPNYKRELA